MITEFNELKDSFISAYNYDDNLGLLNIVFNNGNKINTKYSAYQYIGVPRNIVEQLANDKHPGLLFRTKIKLTYPSRKLNPVEYRYRKSLK